MRQFSGTWKFMKLLSLHKDISRDSSDPRVAVTTLIQKISGNGLVHYTISDVNGTIEYVRPYGAYQLDCEALSATLDIKVLTDNPLQQ
jgi:hypothetical protein